MIVFGDPTHVIPIDEVHAVIAQERDPVSPLRQSLQRGLQELDAGEGIEDDDLLRTPDPRKLR